MHYQQERRDGGVVVIIHRVLECGNIFGPKQQKLSRLYYGVQFGAGFANPGYRVFKITNPGKPGFFRVFEIQAKRYQIQQK